VLTSEATMTDDHKSTEPDFEEEEIESTEAIVDPFDPKKINVVREPMSIFQAMRKIEIAEIKLDPDFQRNIVWDDKRQSRLIESILLKIPLPAFYLDAIEPDKWVVVDGLQRLTTLDRYFNKKSLKLTGLEFLGRQFEGLTFDKLPRSSQRDIEETQLMMFIIRPETPPKVKFTIFYRINTGGMVLTAQEIRHATFPGRAPGLLADMANLDEFQSATHFSVNPRRMDDRECVLRNLAFRITSYKNYNKPDLNDFLGSAMNVINSASDERIEGLRSEFKRAMTLCQKLLGQYAFRKFNRATRSRGPINKALFETWSTAVLDFDETDLLSRAKEILSGLEAALATDGDYLKSLSLATGGINPVRKRFTKAYQIIDSALLA
jgi:hypothetical protein